MVEKEGATGISSYILGILSIVFGFFQPFPGLILGIVGLTLSKKEKSKLGKKAKKLNTWGIIISVIVIIVTFVLMAYAFKQGLTNLNTA
jgi:uncharacterized Tic20 family protein